jgi:hypothetical protein
LTVQIIHCHSLLQDQGFGNPKLVEGGRLRAYGRVLANFPFSMDWDNKIAAREVDADADSSDDLPQEGGCQEEDDYCDADEGCRSDDVDCIDDRGFDEDDYNG